MGEAPGIETLSSAGLPDGKMGTTPRSMLIPSCKGYSAGEANVSAWPPPFCAASASSPTGSPVLIQQAAGCEWTGRDRRFAFPGPIPGLLKLESRGGFATRSDELNGANRQQFRRKFSDLHLA